MATLGNRVVMFGGTDDNDTFDETWTWDGASWTLEHHPGSASPTARFGASAATLDGKVVVFGGVDPAGSPLGDTVFWDGTNWSQPGVQGPLPRFDATMTTY
jgi:hypothetical protein